MKTVLRNVGDGVGIVIPEPMRDALKFEAGQTVQLDVSDERLLVRLVGRRYALDELLAQCDLTAVMPADIEDWQEAKMVGREVW